MSDLVGNPEDQFFHVAAHMADRRTCKVNLHHTNTADERHTEECE